MNDAKDLLIASRSLELRQLRAVTDDQLRQQCEAGHQLALARVQTAILFEKAQQAQHLRTAVDARLHAIAALDGGAHADAVERIAASIDALVQQSLQQQATLDALVQKLPEPQPFDPNRRPR